MRGTTRKQRALLRARSRLTRRLQRLHREFPECNNWIFREWWGDWGVQWVDGRWQRVKW